MRKMLIKSVLFLALLPMVYFPLHIALRSLRRAMIDRPDDLIYVWGDSRTYRGLDLDQLRQLSGRPVLSWAHHGASVYDFLVFTEQVPENCDVVIGFSLPMLLRENSKDYNRSGLSLAALTQIKQSQTWTWKETLRAVEFNRDPFASVAHTTTEPFPCFETSRMDYYQLYHKRFAVEAPPAHYWRKLTLYKYGVKILTAKKCRVTIVDFPVSEVTGQMRRKSIYANVLDELIDLGSDQIQLVSDVRLSGSTNLMYDQSHLNARGRNAMTRYLYVSALSSGSNLR